MRTLRRFLVFQAFLLWQGGFVFYAGVVVPIGTEILGSPILQGQITQRVTDWLNAFGAAWAVVLAWDVAATRDPKQSRRRSRWAGWAGCVALLVALILLHREMDAILEHYDETVYETFRRLHIFYLCSSTLQWFFALLLAAQTLAAWRAEDETR